MLCGLDLSYAPIVSVGDVQRYFDILCGLAVLKAVGRIMLHQDIEFLTPTGAFNKRQFPYVCCVAKKDFAVHREKW